MATNNFKSFAVGVGANVITQAEYEALTTLIANGFLAGTAVSEQLNKVWRQGSVSAEVIGQFIADITAQDALDDGDIAALLLKYKNAVSSPLERRANTAGGTSDAITATFSRAPAAWVPGVPYYVGAAVSNTTTTPTYTPNSGVLAAKTIVKGNNIPLAIADIAGAGHELMLIYSSVLDKVVLMNPANGVFPGTPPGTIIDFAGSTAPTGYLACPTVATNISRTTYAALFAAIGTAWGAGDGSTTFGMPYFPANYASVQASANVGTSTVGAVIAHVHDLPMGSGSSTSGSYVGRDDAPEGTAVSTNSTGGSANLAAGMRVFKCVKF